MMNIMQIPIQNTERSVLLKVDAETYSRDYLGMSNPVVAHNMAA